MFRPRVIPVILIDTDGSVVKTVKFKRKIYIGDPVNAVSLFNAFRVDELVLLDIAATRERRCISLPLLADISSEAKMPFAVGGGISTLEDIHAVLSAGAEKVVISTAGLENPSFVRAASDRFGSSSIVVCIDVGTTLLGRQRVLTQGGRKSLALSPVNAARLMEDMGAGELILQSVDRDGMMNGYHVDLIDAVSQAVAIPLIALGGAGEIEHMRQAYVSTQASGFAAGSMFCFQNIDRGVLIKYPSRDTLDSFRGLR